MTLVPKPPSSARSAMGILATRVVVFPISVAVGILVARALGPSDRGVYAFMCLFNGFWLPIGSFGFGASITYFTSSRKFAASEIILSCVAVGLLQGASIGLLAAGAWWLGLLGVIGEQLEPRLLVPVLLLLPLQGAEGLLMRLIIGASWFRVFNIITFSTPLLLAVFLSTFVLWFDWGLTGAVTSFVLANLLVCALTFGAAVFRFRPSRMFDLQFLREGFAYGTKAWIGDLAVRANMRFDQFVLGISAEPAMLGMYTVAVNIGELLLWIPDSLAMVLFNRLAAQKTTAERARLIGQVHRVLFFLILLMAMVIGAVAGPLIVVLYGEKFAGAVWPFVILLPGTVMVVTTKVITKYFGASGMPGRSSLVQVVGMILGVLLYIILIPILGISGAAIGHSVAFVTTAIVAAVLYARDIKPEKTGLFSLTRDDLKWGSQQVRNALGRTR